MQALALSLADVLAQEAVSTSSEVAMTMPVLGTEAVTICSAI